MAIQSFKIGNLDPLLPIIQGGMGVGISLSQLASAVANAGGIGIISTAQIGFREPDFMKQPLEANLRAIKKEVQAAKRLAPKGIIGVNIMVALSHYGEMVKAAIASGAQLIISGAGLPMELPLYTKDTDVKAVPIVSSAKAASVICRLWDRKYQTTPDSFIVEGPLAGGHLGFKTEELTSPRAVIDITQEVKEVVTAYEEKYQKKIPVIVAGGIYSGDDVKAALAKGADGVQMATRFVTTYECDAHPHFKTAYLECEEKDIQLVKSPVGMPGRAIANAFIQNPPGNTACLYHCIEKCPITTIPYCISKALISAANGDLENALIFCGSNAYKANHLEHVKEIMDEITLALS